MRNKLTSATAVIPSNGRPMRVLRQQQQLLPAPLIQQQQRQQQQRQRNVNHCRGRCTYRSMTTLALFLTFCCLASSAYAASSVSLAASTAPSTTSSSSSISSLQTPDIQQQQQDGSSGNVVIQLASYIKNSIVKTVDNCGQLWTNHGKCKEIRQKMTKHRETVREQWDLQGLYQADTRSQLKQRLAQIQGGITYQEFVFLQKGKEDRAKVMNLMFFMWGAPRFLPYALMLNPDMLPSPFKQQDPAAATASGSVGSNTSADGQLLLETPAQRIWRERSGIFLQTLADLERHAMSTTGSASFLAKLNIFGKKKQQEKHQKLVQVYQETKHALAQTVTMTTDTFVQRMEPLVYRASQDFSRAEQRLVHIPQCLVQGLGKSITGQAVAGFFGALQPHFLHRNKVVSHLRKVTEADDFLVQAVIDLESISPRLLQEACRDRMVGGPDWTPTELRAGLQEWLRVAVQEPSQVLLVSSSSSNSTLPNKLYYNGNVMRMALMAFYGCQAARGVGRTEPTLAQLLLLKQQQDVGKKADSRSGSDNGSSSSSRGSSSSSSSSKGGFFGRRGKRDRDSGS